MTSRKPTTATRTETPPSSGDGGSVTFLHSDDAGSQTLSSRPVQEPATNSTPMVIRPSDTSDMSLTEAAYWIAAEGGSRECDINDAEKWKLSFDQLREKIVEDKLGVLGRRYDDGLHEHVPWFHFLDVQISYPYCGRPADFVTSNKPHLQCWGIVDEEHRRNGFNDKLFQRRLDIEWSDLRVRSVDIALHWPFSKASKSHSGSKMKYDWPDVRDFIFKTMDKNAEFNDWDVGSRWTCQADLARLVMDYMDHKPADSSVKSYVKRYLAEWRASKLANN